MKRDRFLLVTPAAELVPHLEELAQVYRMPFGAARRYGVKGVRTSHIDVLIQESETEFEPVLEIGTRFGSGDVRQPQPWRLCIRAFGRGMGDLLPVSVAIHVHADVVEGPDGPKKQGHCVFELLDPVGERVWCWSGQYFTETVDDWWGIYQFHRTNFYPFLSEQDVIDQFGGDVLPENATLNTANRFVSRSLYRLARNLGYRREADRKSPHFQRWMHETRGLVDFSEFGVGQATLDAAAGLAVPEFSQPDPA